MCIGHPSSRHDVQFPRHLLLNGGYVHSKLNVVSWGEEMLEWSAQRPKYTVSWDLVYVPLCAIPTGHSFQRTIIMKIKFTIIVRWNEWPVRFAHNYTASFRSILRVLSPFSFWEFINVFSHTALFSC